MAALGLCVPSVEQVHPMVETAIEDPDLRVVADAIGFEAASIDEIVARTGLDVATILARLGRLQSSGLVHDAGGWWELG